MGNPNERDTSKKTRYYDRPVDAPSSDNSPDGRAPQDKRSFDDGHEQFHVEHGAIADYDPALGFDPRVTILKAIDMVKVFKNGRGVHNVSLEVQRGEIVVLMGPNGAGKTTSFRMTCGITEPDRGTVYLNGHDVTNWPMYRRAREGGMGYLAQESSIFRDLSVQDNLKGVMELLGFDRQSRNDRCNELLEQFDLAKLRKSKAKTLSGGEKRRLEIARALVSDPNIILLDEPFTGIDPVTIDDIQEIILGLRQKGISILITDHQVREALQIADRCYIIRDGLVLCEGPPEEVVMNEEARRYYFGDDPDLGPSSTASPQQKSQLPQEIPVRTHMRQDPAQQPPKSQQAKSQPVQAKTPQAKSPQPQLPDVRSDPPESPQGAGPTRAKSRSKSKRPDRE